ncbi:glycosyltransferase [Mucisphaera sp.]|uniref:glycosyltransferase n=1 Tax=Mucisphaera sp. TaxID=2913024 RepID=UPI003D0E763D
MAAPLIVNLSRSGKAGEKTGYFDFRLGERLRQVQYTCDPRNAIERLIKRPMLSRIRGGYEAGARAGRASAALLVSHDPRVTFAAEYWAHRFGYQGPHLAMSFNFPALPTGFRAKMMRRAFARIDRFVTYSRMEVDLYSREYDLPPERFTFKHWGVQPPASVPESQPVISGDYVCALGENARDYALLAEAARRLPGIKFVWVVRPYNLNGIDVPENVTVRFNIPRGEAMNILKYSRFMTLALKHSRVPCGHVTLVAAMYFCKTTVCTASVGVDDYLVDGETGVITESGSPQAMAEAIEDLWENREKADLYGERSLAFAQKNCTEDSIYEWYVGYLQEKKIL